VKLLVGLGNPGPAYQGTRHNVGFEVLEVIARRCGSPARRSRFQGEAAQVSIRGHSALLLWPLTWMNLSGSAVLAARDFYKIADADILVVCDDFQLPLDTIRLRPGGSGGGQNGLANVLTRLGVTAIPRLRLGIGPVPEGMDPAVYVLKRYGAAQARMLPDLLERASEACMAWLDDGIEEAMNRFN